MQAYFRLKCIGTDKIIALENNRTVIGRSKDCGLCIEKSDMSRQHALVTVENDRVTLTDMGSQNGTRVNNTLIHTTVTLNHGDLVYFAANGFIALLPLMADDNIDTNSKRQEGDKQSFLVEKAGGDKTSILGRYPKPPGWSKEDDDHFS